MQQEIEERTVGLAVQSTKMSASLFYRAIQYYLRKKETYNNTNISQETAKKVKVKEFLKDGAGVSNVEIQDKSIKQFERLAKKNGVRYAIKKDKSTTPPTFYIFFKSKDAEMIEYTMRQFTKKQLNKGKEPVIKQKLKHFKEVVAAQVMNSKIRKKEKVR